MHAAPCVRCCKHGQGFLWVVPRQFTPKRSVVLRKGDHVLFRRIVQQYTRASGHATAQGLLMKLSRIAQLRWHNWFFVVSPQLVQSLLVSYHGVGTLACISCHFYVLALSIASLPMRVPGM